MNILVRLSVILLMVFSLSASVYQPVSDGDTLWLATLPDGDFVLITHYQSLPYNYVKVVYMDSGNGYTSEQTMLPGEPTSFAISACGHYITVAVSIKDTDTVYTSQVVVPGNVNCGFINTTFIPVVTTP